MQPPQTRHFQNHTYIAIPCNVCKIPQLCFCFDHRGIQGFPCSLPAFMISSLLAVFRTLPNPNIVSIQRSRRSNRVPPLSTSPRKRRLLSNGPKGDLSPPLTASCASWRATGPANRPPPRTPIRWPRIDARLGSRHWQLGTGCIGVWVGNASKWANPGLLQILTLNHAAPLAIHLG